MEDRIVRAVEALAVQRVATGSNSGAGAPSGAVIRPTWRSRAGTGRAALPRRATVRYPLVGATYPGRGSDSGTRSGRGRPRRRGRLPLPDAVGRDVREEQVSVLAADPDGPLGPIEASREHLVLGAMGHEAVEGGSLRSTEPSAPRTSELAQPGTRGRAGRAEAVEIPGRILPRHAAPNALSTCTSRSRRWRGPRAKGTGRRQDRGAAAPGLAVAEQTRGDAEEREHRRPSDGSDEHEGDGLADGDDDDPGEERQDPPGSSRGAPRWRVSRRKPKTWTASVRIREVDAAQTKKVEKHGHRADGVDPEPELFTESGRVDLERDRGDPRRRPRFATVQDRGAEQVEGDRAHGVDGAGDPCVELHDANPAARTTEPRPIRPRAPRAGRALLEHQ